MRHLRVAVALLAVLLPLSCSKNETPANPTPSPSPTPEPTATPTPTPPPAASPTPEPTPETSNEPAVYATAGVHSYRRKGKLVRSPAATYLSGDVIYLNCSPRDKNGAKTTNHKNIKGWGIFSTELTVGSGPGINDFHFTGTSSFNPDLHIHNPISREGTIKAYCTVVDLPRSANHNMRIKKK